MTDGVKGLASRIERSADHQLLEVTPYRATVVEISGDLVRIQAEDEDYEQTRFVARLNGYSPTVTDLVLVIGRTNPIVIDKFP